MDPSRQTRQQQQRPPYPQQTSISSTSSVFQSSSSLTSLSSSVNSQSSHMSAPLPSPSANNSQSSMQYFPSYATQHQTPPTSHPAQQRIPQSQQTSTSSAAYVGQRGDGGGVPTTAPFLNDFNLLAEAAKRAQMACLSRDLGDMGM